MDCLASSSFWGDRARMETRAPSEAARWARARPMPLDPPVMKTWRDLMGILMGLGRTIRAKNARRESGTMGMRRRRKEGDILPPLRVWISLAIVKLSLEKRKKRRKQKPDCEINQRTKIPG